MPRFDPRGDEDPMSTLCRMVVGTTFSDLPDDLVRHARHTLLDGIGVTVGGSGMDGIAEIVDLVTANGGAAESVVPCYGGRVPAAAAALAIGPMPRAMDCGDLHEEAGHVSEYAVASLLAALGLRDDPVTGQEFLTALVVAQEVLVRIGTAYRVISSGIPAGDCGGHYVFGAVAAVGKLLGFSSEVLENAMGIARTMTAPHTMAIYSPATLMVRMHHGLVCQAAITACQLAARGITGPREQVLTGPKGFLASARWETDPDVLTRDLGQRWAASRITTKRHSACYFSHSAIDGITELLGANGVTAADVAGVHVAVSASGWNAVCEPEATAWHPRTVPECQFSLPYAVATAALDGRVFVDSYSEDARARADVRALMARVSAERDGTLPSWGARVRVTLRDGREVVGGYTTVKGHPDLPLDEHDLVEKFRACAALSTVLPLDDGTVATLIDHILALEKVDDVERALLLPLTPG
ncbi:MmgE/PrpD family protein [Actinomycetospora endophytica]|uniref:MmgE/PrpD family protein n=1 Tax=Actinomycetospora endophytica TaxID=2291215 RepID=A0ABS8PJH3_9PSEU|nr:MmgE/PrpD family protein [Actinomycetospora endophytica]MCD2197660.1 MmgE/PrpD family protein [Actinomycetospora endophytica]